MDKEVEEVLRLRCRKEELGWERGKLEGQLEEVLRRLKEEHDCNSLDEAEVKLKKVEGNKARLEKAKIDALAEVEKKWGGKI